MKRRNLECCSIALKHFLCSCNFEIVDDDAVKKELIEFKQDYSDTLQILEDYIQF